MGQFMGNLVHIYMKNFLNFCWTRYDTQTRSVFPFPKTSFELRSPVFSDKYSGNKLSWRKSLIFPSRSLQTSVRLKAYIVYNSSANFRDHPGVQRMGLIERGQALRSSYIKDQVFNLPLTYYLKTGQCLRYPLKFNRYRRHWKFELQADLSIYAPLSLPFCTNGPNLKRYLLIFNISFFGGFSL